MNQQSRRLDTSREHRGTILRRGVATIGAAALALTGLIVPISTSSAAGGADVLRVDLSVSTGAVQGGASGMLYGLGDDGVPTDAIIAGAGPKNVTQKAPHGAQHPNGDPLQVERSLFENGGDYLMVNIQDYYPDWAYNGGKRPEDFDTYLEIVRTVVTSIVEESDYPERYVFTPFNEPDGINWYGNWGVMRDTFLGDWKAAYDTIKEIYPEARIAGPGDAWWHSTSTREILTFAKANDVMPDIWTWHELGVENLATFRGHLEQFRQIEREVGVGPLPVNITEYAMRRDMGVPGQLIQWISMFEDEKVDAQTAYWTYAGNLNDNMAKGNSANGAWWLLKWYADLTGETVQLTPPALNAVDTLQGTAAFDDDKRQATVLFGGGIQDVRLEISGIDTARFGDSVDVQVRQAGFSGQEGESLAPPVVLAERTAVVDGEIQVTVPNRDRHSAYQLVVTPALTDQPTIDATWRTSIEAEATTLRDAKVDNQPAADAWTFAASGQKDVSGLDKATSSLTWQVDVPTTGTYRLGVIAGMSTVGQHALFVDGNDVTTVHYEAGFNSRYRGKAEVLVDLTAGQRTLSLRTSRDGSTRLPGSNLTVDRLDLERVDGPDTTVYPAHLARLAEADVVFDGATDSGSVRLESGASATFYVAARDTGYYDLLLEYSTAEAAALGLTINGRQIEGLASSSGGVWTSRARVHLAKGISEIAVTSPDGADLQSLTTVRAEEGDARIIQVEAESALELYGGARIEGVNQPTNVSGQAVGWLGGGTGSYAVWTRPEGAGAGAYNFIARYSNAEKNTGHAYNTDVITRFLDLSEAGGETTRGAFRHNYSWQGFWTHAVPLDLVTDDGALTLGNATGWAPNLDTVALAPLVLAVSTEGAPAIEPKVAVVVQPRCIAGKGFVSVRATNEDDGPIDVELRTSFGKFSAAKVAPGNSVHQSFNSRSTQVPAGTATVTVTRDGRAVSHEVAYAALTC